MTKESLAQFQLALSRLEKAEHEVKKSSLAFQELEKINFLKEIIQEQIKDESKVMNENAYSSIR